MGAACPPPSSPPIPTPSQSAMQFRLRLWRKRDWMERVCGKNRQCYHPVPSTHGCHVPIPILPCSLQPIITWGIVFILLYRCTSSSFDGMRCCPFPIPVEEARQGLSDSQGTPWGDLGTHATDRDHHPQCSHPAARPWKPPKSVRSSLKPRKCWGFESLACGKVPTWLGRGWCDGMDMGCCHFGQHNAKPPRAHAGSGNGSTGRTGQHRQDWAGQAGPGSTGSLLPEYPKEILEMGLR